MLQNLGWMIIGVLIGGPILLWIDSVMRRNSKV